MIQGESEDSGDLGTESSDESSPEIDEFSEADELDGSPGSDSEKQGLMHTVLEDQQDEVDLGNMVMHAYENGGSMFTPEMLMDKIVQDYRSAEQIIGPALIRRLTGFDPKYVEKNLNIPEFRRELGERIKQNTKELEEQGILENGSFTDEALELATVVMAIQELDHLTAEGVIGERVHKKRQVSGSREETKPFIDETYRSLNIKQSVKTAIRRGHKKLSVDDLKSYERDGRGRQEILYAIDASGSMKGQKISQAKRAGIALAYKAIQKGDLVGLLAFGKDVLREIPPCKNFSDLLRVITRLKSGSETDIASCIRHSISLFKGKDRTKHLFLLTDALPTVGVNPGEEVMAAVSEAKAAGVTVSVIGIALDDIGEKLAQQIVDVSDGRLAVVKDLENLDVIVLEEYEALH